MAAEKHKGLELNEDRRFQEKMWTLERIAWVVMALVLLVALVGLTGRGGPLSTATVSTPQGEVTYPRIARWEANDSLILKLPPGAPEATVDIGKGFGELFEIIDIQPQPTESSSTGEGHRMTFKLDEPPGSHEVTIHLRAAAPSFGKSFEVRLNGGSPMTLTPVVLP